MFNFTQGPGGKKLGNIWVNGGAITPPSWKEVDVPTNCALGLAINKVWYAIPPTFRVKDYDYYASLPYNIYEKTGLQENSQWFMSVVAGTIRRIWVFHESMTEVERRTKDARALTLQEGILDTDTKVAPHYQGFIAYDIAQSLDSIPVLNSTGNEYDFSGWEPGQEISLYDCYGRWAMPTFSTLAAQARTELEVAINDFETFSANYNIPKTLDAYTVLYYNALPTTQNELKQIIRNYFNHPTLQIPTEATLGTGGAPARPYATFAADLPTGSAKGLWRTNSIDSDSDGLTTITTSGQNRIPAGKVWRSLSFDKRESIQLLPFLQFNEIYIPKYPTGIVNIEPSPTETTSWQVCDRIPASYKAYTRLLQAFDWMGGPAAFYMGHQLRKLTPVFGPCIEGT